MIFLILLSIVIGIVFWWRYKSVVNPVTMFSFLWAVIFVLYQIDLLDYYALDTRTVTVYYVQMIAFAIGAAFATVIKVNKGGEQYVAPRYEMRRMLVYALAVITAVSLLTTSFEVIRNLLSGKNFSDIVNEGDIITENDSVGLRVGIKMVLIDPITAMISPIVASEIINPKAKNKLLLFVLNVVIVLLHTLQHGGRDMLIVFGISYFFAYMIDRRTNKLLSASKPLVVSFWVAGIATVIFSVWVSASRGIDDLGESLYYYFSGAVPHLQTCINEISVSDMTFGAGMTYGILLPLLVGLRGFGIITDFPLFATQIEENFLVPTLTNKIGSDVIINAHVGLSYYFYCDGGLPFVFIGCLALGFASVYIYKKMLCYSNVRNNAIYFFMMCVILMSFIRFQLTAYRYALALVYIMLLVYRRKDTAK